MTLESVKKMKQLMPWKQIFFDVIYGCYRLIDPMNLYEYKDDEGCCHQRKAIQIKNLIPIN